MLFLLLFVLVTPDFLRAENCICSRRFRPVCGTDEVTYDNRCLLNCAAIVKSDLSVAYNGTCCPRTVCPSFRSPICDNFGRTHINECFLNRVRCIAKKTGNRLIEKVHDGECRSSENREGDCERICTELGGPICDENGNSHQNECSLERLNCKRRKELKQDVALAYFGPCDQSKITDSADETNGSGQAPIETEIEPIANSEASFNRSEFSETSAHVLSNVDDKYSETKNEFPTPPIVSISQPFDISQPCSAANCDKIWNPVCDSNNRTHRNLCLFKFHACKINRLDGSIVSLSYEGECSADVVIPKTCNACPSNENRVSVCDNLNQTHASLCELTRFNCLQRELNLAERVLIHIHPCHSRSLVFSLENEKCPENCGTEFKPVCDEVGVTHRNLCQFQLKNCHIRKNGRHAPMLKFLRACSSASVNPHDEQGLIMLRSEASVMFDDTVLPETFSTEQYPTVSPSTTTPTSVRFECPTPSCDDDNSFPVCDSNGHFHNNVCSFTYARCMAAQKGVFLTIDQEEKCISNSCNENCSNETKPLCATDFTTYQNLCHYSKQKCVDHSLDILFFGHCSECLPSPCLPLPSDAPDSSFVCDSEDQTRTLCEFQMLSCIVDKNGGLNFTIQHIGKCCGTVETCSKEPFEPLCGNEGRTYKNKCEFNLENCRNDKLMVPLSTIAHTGECIDPSPSQVPSEEDAFELLENFNIDIFNSTIENITCPSSCDNIYSPVCGSDDVTYTNLCFLQTENCRAQTEVKVIYQGECCEVQCPSNLSPVCDDQGNSHQNLCFFGKERCLVERLTGKNLSIAKFDVCTDDCAADCPNTYLPICGSNGATYINQCELDRHNCFVRKNITTGETIKKDYDGECCQDLKCDYEFSPVCDSEGTTHANECIFRQASCVQSKKFSINVTIQYKGACCIQPCEDSYSPVCDGQQTHENTCRFRIAQCEAERRGSVLSVAYPGECCSLPQGQCNSSGSVCDSDGQTHTDMCSFRNRKCIVERTAKKTLSIVHGGECCVIEACRKGEEPVCDSNGGTHASRCHFENTKCIHDKIHPNNKIYFSYNGSCCSGSCGNSWDPVCDQHGAVYKNQCYFKLKSCEQNRKYGGILLETPCPQRKIRRLR